MMNYSPTLWSLKCTPFGQQGLRMGILLLLLLWVVGCGGTTEAPPTETAVPPPAPTETSVPPTATPEPPATPLPTEPPEPTATERPTRTPTPETVELTDEGYEQLKETLRTLLGFTATIDLMDGVAEQIEAGDLNETDAEEAKSAIAELLDPIAASFGREAPLATLQSEWEEAATLFESLQSLNREWVANEVSATELLAELDGIRDELGPIVQGVPERLEEQHGLSQEEYLDILLPVYEEVSAILVEAIPETSEEGEPEVNGVPTDVYTLRVGDCFSFDETGDISTVLVVPCEAPHLAEVYALIDYPADANEAWVGQEAMDTFSDEECTAAFEPYVGIAYADSIYYISYLQPTETSWDNGDRELVCLIVEANNNELTGSAKDSGQ